MNTEIQSQAKGLAEARQHLAKLTSHLESQRNSLRRLQAEQANLGKSTALTRDIAETNAIIRRIQEQIADTKRNIDRLSSILN